MTSEIVQTLANSSGAALVAFISFWYLKEKDKRDQETHRGYQKTIADLSAGVQEIKSAMQMVYVHAKGQSETIKKQAALLKEYECKTSKKTVK
jgi:hypothetical protein